ncbi:uncharacterized protein F5891DRAFT_974223 [Suillus fuscotomentosus]|uniref:Uncharacterized protein n=1 Tax=Suillus fuscotomentosus TaxID=1912939 RepID=A0AAD4DQ61_9AGAM|nr:uncharacterized protein F5891DRAFT_1198757 [Suillus fuscotomentosus]XP_041234522.1 uncharacterized protein F5891DRAFT_974223 [Suillus fuscotomentosus]KAG1889099.1 hypothetical protein F5891DRAFT_1198757 [Suillus fuscotomentosus]KAG1908947.1 hypothetical protein F5891DRAFT_974223 [Suillus fuscotomentosus]
MSKPTIATLSAESMSDEMDLDLADIAAIFEYATSRLSAIQTELESTRHTLPIKTHRIIGQYLNWEGESFTLPWMSFCAGLSISPPLSRNLWFFVGVLSMKQAGLVTNFEEIYNALMTLPAAPAGPWQKGRLARTYWTPWWMNTANIIADDNFLHTYPNCVQVQQIIAEHFKQLPEGKVLITPATLTIPMCTPVAEQLSNIHAKVLHKGQLIVKMLEDKVVEAKMVAATMLRMDTALGQDIVKAIAATKKLTKYLKRKAAQ